MDNTKGWVGLLFALTCMTSSATVATAQTSTIRGIVADSEGNPIPGATIDLYSESGAYTRRVISSDNGSYIFGLVTPGWYGVRASLTGFAPTVREFFEAKGGVIYSLPLTLRLQAVTQEIVVMAEAAPGFRDRPIRKRKVEGPRLPAPRNPVHDAGTTPKRRDSANARFEAHAEIAENKFELAAEQPASTFSIDVDTASYSMIRQMLEGLEMPPTDAVRIEEMLNSFSYDDPPPTDELPFSIRTETASAPWNPRHRLLRIALRGRVVEEAARPAANLVFLIDVSGSMQHENKLPLVKQALKMLTVKLRAEDRVAVVVYAGSSGLALPSISGSHKQVILDAIDRLEAGGSTDGSSGITLAYAVASENFIEGGINRVILCTDGDFNMGVTDERDLTRLVRTKSEDKIFLSALGFGIGNYRDEMLETLADKGDGNYAYIDSRKEARKVLVQQLSGTLQTIAKDVKVQIHFDRERIVSYRLIGYENRILDAADFDDDAKDAGEIGAGHSVIALYELVPRASAGADSGTSRPAEAGAASEEGGSDAFARVQLRYKKPDERHSSLIEKQVRDAGYRFEEASTDFRFSAAVAAFGMLLRESPHAGSSTLEIVLRWAKSSRGEDPSGQRAELIQLVKQAMEVKAMAAR